MTITESVAAFLIALAVEAGPSTLRCYRSRLAGLVRVHGLAETAHLERSQVEGWLQTATAGKAPDTIRLTLIAWERFQAWAVAQGHLPAELLPRQRKPGGRKREALPTKAQTRQLLEHLPAEARPIFRALRLTGARPGELCGATIADWDRVAGKITLVAHKTVKKTGKPRVIAVGHKALVEILQTAVGDRPAGPLFLRSCGRAWSTSTLSSLYRAARKTAGLPDDLVLYLTRHEHATDLYRATKDIKAVADALGHAQIGTTMRYARAQLDVLQEQQAKFDEGLEAPD